MAQGWQSIDGHLWHPGYVCKCYRMNVVPDTLISYETSEGDTVNKFVPEIGVQWSWSLPSTNEEVWAMTGKRNHG